MRKLKIYICLGGVDIFHRSVNMFLYFVFTKLSALNAYNDFDLWFKIAKVIQLNRQGG